MTQPYALNPMNRISIGMPNTFYNEIIMSGEGCFIFNMSFSFFDVVQMRE